MTGPIPAYINGMITMTAVQLHNNRFTGRIPGRPKSAQNSHCPWERSRPQLAMPHAALQNSRLKLTLSAPFCAGTLPPDWGKQGFLVNNTYNATQAMEKL